MVTFVASYFGVMWFRAFTLQRGLLDIPNERSSHVTPTPRGGGLVMAIVAIAGYVVGCVALGEQISVGYLIGSAIIVLVGWLDDVFSLSFIWRLIAQGLAAGIVIYFCGAITSFYLPGFGLQMNLGWSANILTGLLIVWLLNAYNFMDGIDGIAGLQAVIAASSWVAVGIMIGGNTVTIISLALAAAAFGFLPHNWQPAKIFMGDAGSSFLGFSFAVLPILARSPNEPQNAKFATFALLAIWPFVFDSAITIVRRGLRGEKVWSAHREHLYQRLVISGQRHSVITAFYGGMSAVVATLAIFMFLYDHSSLIGYVVLFVASLTAILTFYLASRYGHTVAKD